MAETINDRIESLVNHHFNGNKAAFAKAIDMPPTGLSSYLGKQRRSKPNVDMIIKIIKTLNVDPLWLLTGEESKRIDVSTQGSYSPASALGNVSVKVDNCHIEKEIEFLKKIIEEKDERIKELKERIVDLKSK